MRTNIVIDDKLMTRALRAGGYETKKATVEAGLRLLIQIHSQQKLKNLRGKVDWEGDLDGSRQD